jgi:C_GCAxxG_C_C family probable redox protein
MNRQQVEQRTEELFRGGLHCAEAVLQAVLESQDVDQATFSPKVATAFGGGVGRSKKGLCGALSGGLIALGYLRGRSTPEESWEEIAVTADELRARFTEEYGCSRCGVVLERLGPQEKMDKCVRLAGNTAGMVFEALAEEAAPCSAQACGCGCTQLHAPEPTPAPTPSSCGCGGT